MSTDDTAFVNSLYLGFGFLSIAGASAVLFGAFALYLYDPRLCNRVSLRLACAQAIIDIGYELLEILPGNLVPNMSCGIQVFLIVLTSNLYMFLAVSVAINLQRVFLHNKKYLVSMELMYYGVSIALSVVLSGIPWIFGQYGFDDGAQLCWYVPSGKIIWETITLLLPMLLCFVYSGFVISLMFSRVYELGRQRSAIQRLQGPLGPSAGDTPEQMQKRREINMTAFRITFYLVNPFLTQFVYVVSEFQGWIAGHSNQQLVYASIVLFNLPGFLNFLAFMCDPAILQVKNRIFKKWNRRNKKAREKTTRTPQTAQDLRHLNITSHLFVNEEVGEITSHSSSFASSDEDEEIEPWMTAL